MQKIDFTDRAVRIALADIERHQSTITSDCIQCWDSMTGTLPSFKKFCTMYMKDRMKRWMNQARWN